MKSGKVLLGMIAVLSGMLFFFACNTFKKEAVTESDTLAIIEPDYSGITIPPNIAPLNLIIKEAGISYRVDVHSADGLGFSVKSTDGNIRFPLKSWQKLLSKAKGNKLTFVFFVEGADKIWSGFKPIYVSIANETVDPYLCYRLLYPGYETWSGMEIIQRCVENFDESSIIINQSVDNNCINCHTFRQNDPDKFLIHIRGSLGGTYFVDADKITKTDLKSEDLPFGATYPAWHPDGEIVAFSSNRVTQTFQAIQNQNIEVLDLSSDLILYNIGKNEIIKVVSEDSVKYMETFPEWSPDGEFLYYCRAHQFEEGGDFKKIKYDLVRRPFNKSSNLFGKSEIVFNAIAIDKSVSFPRISPDGKYLVFTLHNYGTFSIWHKEADLYLMDLQTGETSRMNLNSDESESYHSWSSNSKWLVFSSKRGDGLTARPYFAYIGSGQEFGKPFVLPQKDPGKYNIMLKTFNRPEFITGKIKAGSRDFSRAARGEAIKARIGQNQ